MVQKFIIQNIRVWSTLETFRLYIHLPFRFIYVCLIIQRRFLRIKKDINQTYWLSFDNLLLNVILLFYSCAHIFSAMSHVTKLSDIKIKNIFMGCVASGTFLILRLQLLIKGMI